MPKKGHGGKRQGAGRKPSGRTKRVGPFMLSPESAKWLDEQDNKSAAIDELIKRRKNMKYGVFNRSSNVAAQIVRLSDDNYVMSRAYVQLDGRLGAYTDEEGEEFYGGQVFESEDAALESSAKVTNFSETA